jgi:PAS domain S-box-containing protein
MLGPRGEAESECVDLREEFDAQVFENLLLDLSIKFINLPSDEVDQQVEEAQRRVCDCIDVDLSALWQWDPGDPGNLTMTHLYRPLGGPPVPERTDAREFWPWSLGLVQAGKTVVVSSLEDLPPEAATDREMWVRFDVISSLCFPLSVGGGPALGALSFNTTRAERTWPNALVRRLSMVAQVFANAIARKRLDDALRESEEKLALAAESAGAGLWSLNLARGSYWVTPRTRELLGLPENESLTLDRFLGLVHSDDRDSIRRAIREVVSSGEEGQAEFRIVRPDGTVRWLASRGRARLNAPNGPERLMGVSVDITERKRLEEVTRNLTGRIIAAHEEERARLARELHDDITQRVACMSVEVARLEAQTSTPAIEESLHGLRKELARMGEDVHALSYRLHPSILAELGLTEAIRAECERFTRQHGIAVEFALDEVPESTPRDASLCLFRVAQEALRNVARHAGAGRVEVSIRERDGGLELEVRDDGQGFDATVPPNPPTLGLSGMRERVRHLGGQFDVESAPRRGTSVLTRLPLAGRSP